MTVGFDDIGSKDSQKVSIVGGAGWRGCTPALDGGEIFADAGGLGKGGWGAVSTQPVIGRVVRAAAGMHIDADIAIIDLVVHRIDHKGLGGSPIGRCEAEGNPL